MAPSETPDNYRHHKQLCYPLTTGKGATNMTRNKIYGQAGGSPFANIQQASHLRGIAETIQSGRARLEADSMRQC